MKKVLIRLSIASALLLSLFGFGTELLSNSWYTLTGRGFIVPKESSLFTFQVTQMNEGSGEWWTYGEDNNYYYSTQTSNEHKYYKAFPKAKAQACEGFNKLNVTSWCY